jgi:hypothetical protein
VAVLFLRDGETRGVKEEDDEQANEGTHYKAHSDN